MISTRVCSQGIRTAFEIYEESKKALGGNPSEADLVNRMEILMKSVRDRELEARGDYFLSFLKLLADLAALVCLAAILIFHHRYWLGCKLYQLKYDKKPVFAFGLFVSEARMRVKYSRDGGPSTKPENILEPHSIIVELAIGAFVDIFFFALFLLQIVAPWRFIISITTISKYIKEIRSLSWEEKKRGWAEQVIESNVARIRKECFSNLIMTIADIIALAIFTLTLLSVWRIYYQIYILQTLTKKLEREEAARRLRITESDHRLDMLFKAELKLFGNVLVDLLVLPFMLVNIVTVWNWGKLYKWLSLSRHDDFGGHRFIVLEIFAESLTQILALIGWIIGVVALLRIRTFFRFAKVIKKNKEGGTAPKHKEKKDDDDKAVEKEKKTDSTEKKADGTEKKEEKANEKEKTDTKSQKKKVREEEPVSIGMLAYSLERKRAVEGM